MTFKNILNRNQFITKVIESFFGRVSYVFFTMLFSLVCTRLYGVEIFGEYTYAFTIISLIMIAAKAGMDNGLIYHIPKYKNKHVSLSFLVNGILSLIIIIILTIFIDDTFTKLMFPLVWLLSMEQIFFGIYRATGKVKEFYYINGFGSILLRILLVVSFYFFIGKDALSIVIAMYISLVFANLVYYNQNKKRFNKVVYDKAFLKYSFPLVFAAVLGVVMDRIDIIMLGMMSTNKNVGIYQIAVQVANITSILLIIFNTVFAPQISNLFHKGRLEELKNLYVRSTRVLGLISLITITILIMSSKFILFIFGAELVEGQMALIMRGIGQFVNVAVGGVWFMLAMTGKPKPQMYCNFAACVLNVVLNFTLIPIYGINGAAFASMLSIILINVMGYILVTRTFKVKAYGII